MLQLLARIFGGGFLDRVLDTVDKRIDAETDKDRIKGEAVQTYMRTRSGWLEAGGLITLLMFAAPAAFWRGSVYVYSVLWCRDCIWPQDWTVADIPGDFMEMDGWIVLASIGVVGLSRLRK